MIILNKKQELQDVTITHVSYVKRGANKKQFLFAKSADSHKDPDVEFDVKVIKNDDAAKKLLYGIVYEPNEIDAHGDSMNADEIEKTAHEFMKFYRNIDTEHNLIAGAGYVVECYIAPVDMEIGTQKIKKGSWVLVTQATDEIWEDYLNGEITGYSMYGIARTTVTKTDQNNNKKIGWMQKLLENIGIVKTFEETLESEINEIKTNPFFIIDMMTEDWYKSVNWSQTNDESLMMLAKSMKDAATYIDKIVNKTEIAKSENNNAASTSVNTNVEGEPQKPIQNHNDNDDDIPENSDNKPTAVEANESEINAIKEQIDILTKENEKLKKQFEDAVHQINLIKTDSNVREDFNVNTIYNKPIKPQLL